MEGVSDIQQQQQQAEGVPVAQRSSWSSFLKSIASVSGDLSSLTAPPFILSPTSLTEFPAYWCERPHLFAAIADAHDSEARALAVLRWFISTLKDQYTSRNESMGSEKKPLNPVLGELFYGYWPGANNNAGRTTLLVEQVSHHPPITAYVIENKSKGLQLLGHNAAKTSFSSGSIIVRQIGHAILTVQGTQYLITLPKLRIDGLWYGSPYIELTDSSYIIGDGFLATIDYKGKGYFTGKSHTFKATLSPLPGMGGSATKEHVVEGLWHEKSKYTKGPRADTLFHDVLSNSKDIVTVVGGLPDGSQGPYETRTLWSWVAKGIREGDHDLASREKTKIEVHQRQMRKDELAEERKWELKHFKQHPNDPTYEKLGKLAKMTPHQEDYYEFLVNWPPSLVD